jgi:hypothetical protein
MNISCRVFVPANDLGTSVRVFVKCETVLVPDSLSLLPVREARFQISGRRPAVVTEVRSFPLFVQVNAESVP